MAGAMDNKDDDRPTQKEKELRIPYNPPVHSPICPAYTPTSSPYSPWYTTDPIEYTPNVPHYTPYSPSPAYIPSAFHPAYTPASPPYSPSSSTTHPAYTDPIEYTPNVPHYTPYPPIYSPSYHTGHAIMSSNNNPPPSLIPSRKLRESIRNQTDVALGITKQLLLTLGKDKNIVYSLLSIQIGLGMILAGTKEGGHVQDKFLSFLKSKTINELNDLASNVYPLVFADGHSKGGPRISFANGVWVEKSLRVKPGFKDVVEKTYKAALIDQADFRTQAEAVRREVNSWVEKETNGLIENLIGSSAVSSKTNFIFANALYFKGAWSQKFNESETREFDFHLLGGSKVIKTLFMTSSRNQYINVFDTFKVLKLHYTRGEDYDRRFCMCVFLPNTKDGLEALVERVCTCEQPIDGYIPNSDVPVGDFLIPKFKITTEFEPLRVVEQLGLSFKNGDLTEMVELEGDDDNALHMYQKSFVEVNEQGTEATCAVYTACAPSYSPGMYLPKPVPVDFVADHPFLFLIREEVTGTVMFVGHVLNPIEEK